MSNLPALLAGLIALLLGLVLGAGLFGTVMFVGVALAGHHISERPSPGAETVYWLAVAATALFILISIFGPDLPRLIVMMPMIFAIGHGASMLTRRLTRQTT